MFRVPYWQMFAIPALLIVSGATSNQLVLISNHGKFPVMMNERQIVKSRARAEAIAEYQAAGLITLPENFKKFSIQHTYITSSDLDLQGQFLDDVHSFMGANSHLKVLSDIFDMGRQIESIGDFFIDLGQLLWTYAPFVWAALIIRKFNERSERSF